FVCHPIFLHLAWEYLNQPGITLFFLLHQYLVRIMLSLKFPPGINVGIMIMFLLYDKFSFITYIKRLLHHFIWRNIGFTSYPDEKQIVFYILKVLFRNQCYSVQITRKISHFVVIT